MAAVSTFLLQYDNLVKCTMFLQFPYCTSTILQSGVEVWWLGMFQLSIHVFYVHKSHRCDSTQPGLGGSLIVQTSIMQAADGGQLPGRGEIRTRDPQFGKGTP